MHPAFSVIVFTTLSGAGYGLWFWLALSLAGSPGGHGAVAAHGLGFGLGLLLVSAGLLSSTLHLGKPLRAWRAFSQWRSSWLSREGVLAILAYGPVLALLALGVMRSPWLATLGLPLLAAIALLSLATVACTAMIYASLTPIPAWRHRLVLPVYLGFALLCGGLLAAALLAWGGETPSNMVGFAVLLLALGLGGAKQRYWRDIDRAPLAPGMDRNAALGLPAGRTATVFEHPHTEANYLTREMGFVLARKHSRRLRMIALVLFAALPALCGLPLWLLPHVDAAPLLTLAAASTLLGAAVERWLFFAEAKHAVTLYY